MDTRTTESATIDEFVSVNPTIAPPANAALFMVTWPQFPFKVIPVDLLVAWVPAFPAPVRYPNPPEAYFVVDPTELID